MRNKQDKEYGQILSRLRVGKHTWPDFEKLNTKYVDPSNPTDAIYAEFQKFAESNELSFPISCQGNAIRNAIYWLSVCEAAIQNASF